MINTQPTIKSLSKLHPIMEEVLLRFPHLGEQIFKKLLNKNLLKCMNVSKTWYHFISKENFYKLRVKYENGQKNVDRFGKTPLHKAAEDGDLSKCITIINNVENKNPANFIGKTPLHFAARFGHLDVCRFIIENVLDKNPAANDGQTPLHLAAMYGRLEICRLIVDNVEDKNPANNDG